MTPKQRMKINGTYLEDIVTGYETLEVSGREENHTLVSLHVKERRSCRRS